jgi:hypothetical protein
VAIKLEKTKNAKRQRGRQKKYHEQGKKKGRTEVEQRERRKKKTIESKKKQAYHRFTLVFRAQIHIIEKRTSKYKGELDIEI